MMKRLLLILGITILAVFGMAFTSTSSASAGPPQTVNISGLDLHDGALVHSGSTWYLYGTRYGCGFFWGRTSPWCGFGVATSRSPQGPFTFQKLLFNPATVIHANWTVDNGKSWNGMCGFHGAGCFNARMVQTPTGQWLLWFNATGDKSRNANPYWNMTCSGPEGPCSAPHKPAIYSGCRLGGDFSIAVQGKQGWITCTNSGSRVINLEPLTTNDRDGVNSMATVPTAFGESPGILHLSTGGYEMVISAPNCGYCSGTKAAASGAVAVSAGFALAPNIAGPWVYQGNLPGGTCVGQPRSSSNGFELVDRWNGTAQEPDAAVGIIPMDESPWSCK